MRIFTKIKIVKKFLRFTLTKKDLILKGSFMYLLLLLIIYMLAAFVILVGAILSASPHDISFSVGAGKVIFPVLISGLLVFIIWKTLSVKGKARFIYDYVLNGLVFGICWVIAGGLPALLIFGWRETAVYLLVNLIIWVPLCTLVGWIVGKLSMLKVKNAPKIISEKTAGLVNAVKDATDDVQGAKLVKSLAANLQILAELDENLFHQSISAFVSKRESLRTDMLNMSPKGCIQTGQKLQTESRKMADLDKSGACALWLAGAWLESLYRTSDKAKEVHGFLDDMNADNWHEWDTPREGFTFTPNMPNITKCEPIKQTEVGEFTVVLVKDVPAIDDSLKIIEYYFVMALISNKTNLPIFLVTSEGGLSGDSAFLCGFDGAGMHENYGNDLDYKDIKVFSKAASKIIKSEMPDSYAFSS
jgi:hypothetical protein